MLLRSALMGLAFFLIFIFYFIIKSPIQNSELPLIENAFVPPASEQTRFWRPMRLKIPSLNVDAAVEPVGLTPGGAMDVPKNRNDVAWFDLSSRPGEKGSAVMAGHFDWQDGASAVFDNLYKLQPGDKLSVEDGQGAATTFVVRASRSYEAAADASEVFVSNDGQAHLNLVTCEGVWNKTAKSYPQRLVVFTDKVDSTGSPQE